MAEERVQRKLAAILAADVVGYSRLMGEDESGTLAALKQLRTELVDPAIAEYKGHIVKLMGDGALVEFASAVDAVECAVDIQQSLAARNASRPENEKIWFRIGINIGDIIIDGEDIYGDGVNVAARLEGEAVAGGICISSDAYRQVVGKIHCAFEDLGELTLKNITSPVRAYQVLLDDASTFSSGALKVPDIPSIAVLPFDNMSGDPEQEYFADGIAEDIITGLSKFHWFFVIARNSSFSYKGTSPDVRQVAEELGVQYVLEGSVRKGGNRVRITAQLVDALTGRHVWADRYDRDLEDIFAVQDEISEAITTTVAPAFVSAEALRIERKEPENFDAWDYCIRGNWYLSRGGKDDIAEAKQLFETALDLDPKNTMALSGFAMTAMYQISFGWAADVEEVRAASHAAARRAVDLDENDAWAHVALGWSSFFMHQLDTTIAECRRALELNPNLAAAETWLAIALSWQGENDEAVRHAEEATRLSPRDPHSLGSLAREVAEFGAGRYEQAVEWGKKTTEVTPDLPAGWRYLAASLAHLGRLEEARTAIDQLLRMSPHDNLGHIRAAFPSDQADRIDRWIDGLRKAGLPEG